MTLPLFRETRLRLGMTQSEVSHQAGVALPTLQALESGKSNPSFETLERLGKVLGLSLEIRHRPCDWPRLSRLGLPWMAPSSPPPSKEPPSADLLAQEIRHALTELEHDESAPDSERKRDALAGLLLALSEHYPTYFRTRLGRCAFARALIRRPTGRTLKLKRLALARLSEYL